MCQQPGGVQFFIWLDPCFSSSSLFIQAVGERGRERERERKGGRGREEGGVLYKFVPGRGQNVWLLFQGGQRLM